MLDRSQEREVQTRVEGGVRVRKPKKKRAGKALKATIRKITGGEKIAQNDGRNYARKGGVSARRKKQGFWSGGSLRGRTWSWGAKTGHRKRRHQA